MNRTALLDRLDGDEDLLAELVELFAADCPRLLEEGKSALAARDGQRLLRAAHTLKGAVGNFCAPTAYGASQRLGALGEAGRLTEAPGAFAALEVALERLNAELARLSPGTVAR